MRRSLTITIVGILLSSGAAPAAEIIVPTQMPLSFALAAANSGDTITLLPAGSPYQSATGYSFSSKRLTIRGSTGNAGDVVLDAGGFSTVLEITGAGADGSIIRDLTVRNGRGASTPDSSGGGIRILDSNVSLLNCVVRDNTVPASDGNGAGLYANGGSNLTIDQCLFENNTIDSDTMDGGAIYFNLGSHTITNTTFRANGRGASGSPATTSLGGALYADGGSIQLTRCLFEGNRGGAGGAVYFLGNETVTIDACQFVGNNGATGGGFCMASGTAPLPIIRNSLFVDNTTTGNDAALFTNRGAVIRNCTITGNSATGSYVVGGSPAALSVSIQNSIIWGNSALTGIMPANYAVVRSSVLSAPYSTSGSGANLVENPLLVNPGAGDYRLAAGSPAIDAGDSTLYAGPFSDLDSLPRAVDDPSTADMGISLDGPIIDIGAYEFGAGSTGSGCTADVDDGSASGTPDGGVTIDDLIYFLNRFDAGC